MLIQAPFFIGSRLLPALKIGDATLSLDLAYQIDADNRDRATFYLDFPGGTSYRDDQLRSGVGGFKNPVEAFESFLAFLEAAIEALRYEMYSGRTSENKGLFPEHVVNWAHEESDGVEMARSDITDSIGRPRTELIQEQQ